MAPNRRLRPKEEWNLGAVHGGTVVASISIDVDFRNTRRNPPVTRGGSAGCCNS